MTDSAQDYKMLLSEFIKKQIVILGPAITLAKIKKVHGLQVLDDGTISTISDKPENINKQLIDQFTELSLPIVKKTMAPLMQHTETNTSPPPADEEDHPVTTELQHNEHQDSEGGTKKEE